jgi:hypothetical protein
VNNRETAKAFVNSSRACLEPSSGHSVRRLTFQPSAMRIKCLG